MPSENQSLLNEGASGLLRGLGFGRLRLDLFRRLLRPRIAQAHRLIQGQGSRRMVAWVGKEVTDTLKLEVLSSTQ